MADILVKTIIQVAGSPKEHVEKAMNLLEDSLKKNHEIISSKLHKPEKKENSKLYLSFLDMDILFKGISEIVGFIIDYHPSSIEIIEPETIKEDAQELTFVLNDLLQKVHNLDLQVKALLAKNKILESNKKD